MQSQSTFTRESLNFLLHAQERQCFYEDITLDSPTRVVDVFIHSATGDMSVLLGIYGPLDYKDLVHVRHIKATAPRSLELNSITNC